MVFRVEARDGKGGVDMVGVSVDVTNVDEQSATPAASATAGSETSLDVAWAVPARNGGPAIEGYNLQYRQGIAGDSSDWTHSAAATTARITGLTRGTGYQVRVRALNGETPNDWSEAGSGRTNNATGAPAIVGPAFVGGTLAVSTSGITDANGLASPAFAYRWIRVDADGLASNATDIAGGNRAGLRGGGGRPRQADPGAGLFSDDAGNREALTSEAFSASGTIAAPPVCAAPDLTGRRLVWTSDLQVGRRAEPPTRASTRAPRWADWRRGASSSARATTRRTAWSSDSDPPQTGACPLR